MEPGKAYVAVTDRDWFQFLSSRSDIEEVNFWRPSAKSFKALRPGELFLFKLHSPHNYIVGGGYFAHATTIPAFLAWQAFGERNGAASFEKMCELIESYSHAKSKDRRDYSIGCILLHRPFFLARSAWVAMPDDFAPNIVSGKIYDLSHGSGQALWQEVSRRIPESITTTADSLDANTRGKPRVVIPRVGQGIFRLCITDAYHRACAMTGERALPVLEAAHILPVKDGGQHQMQNGLLLRSDLHALFDHGYITVTPDLRIRVSQRLKTEFDNGQPYFPLNNQKISTPNAPEWRPSSELLKWHAENVYRSA